MEDKDSFIEYLRLRTGPEWVKPEPEVRDRHLAAMQSEVLRQRRKRNLFRFLTLGGLLIISGLSLFLAVYHNSRNLNLAEPAALDIPSDPTQPKQLPSHADSHYYIKPSASHAGSDTLNRKTTQTVSTQPETAEKPNGITGDGNTVPSRITVMNTGYMQMREFSVFSFQNQLWTTKKISLSKISLGKYDTIQPATKIYRKSGASGHFSMGLHYTPEFIFNTLNLTDKWIHNAGLEIIWKNKPLSIRTGISLSRAAGVTGIQYTYNEFLGTAMKLDSVSFAFDPVAREIVPDWYFSQYSVYDTATDLNIKYIRKRYTYLQFPMILGYDFFDSKKIHLGMRAGPILQVLLSTNQLDTDTLSGNNRILSINQLTPDRLKTHWQAIAGMNMGITLSGKLRLELEPHMKYYFNSVYEKSATIRKPWSVGLGIAIHYDF